MPSTSASSDTRNPIVLLTTQPMMNARVNEYTVTMPLHSAWRPSWVTPPPANRPLDGPPSAISEVTLLVPNRPIHSEPIHPPTKCTPTTSSESSKPSLNFRLTDSAQTAPAVRPSRTDANGVMYPQAGV